LKKNNKKRKKLQTKRQSEKVSPGFRLDNLTERQKDFFVFALLFIFLLLFFNEFVFENKTVKAADTLASIPFIRWGNEQNFQKDNTVAQWIPNLFSGMPSYGSFVVTPSYPVSMIFINLVKPISSKWAGYLARNIIHLLFAGISMFFFMRSKNLDRFSSFFSAITFIFTCHLISILSAGHTIKLWSISYIPIMFLLTNKVIDKPSVRTTIVAGMVFGLMMMARHVQIVYYFLMAIALFIFFMLGWEFRQNKQIKPILLKLLSFGCVIAIGLMLAAFLYLPIYEYSIYSIRGSSGVAYDYATSWSFHPSEMITFLIPSAYGFGGQTYWGGDAFHWQPYVHGAASNSFSNGCTRLSKK